MSRLMAPVLLIVVAAISLSLMVFVKVPQNVAVAYPSSTTVTAVNAEILLDYSTSTITCPGTPPTCFMQVYPFTYTDTWSAQSTQIVMALSTSTSQIQFVASGVGGDIGVALILGLLGVGIVLLAKGRWP